MISKECFLKTITGIKEGLEQRDKFDKTMSEFTSTWFVSELGESWLNSILDLLEEIFNDHPTPKYDSMIRWWLFGRADKKIWWEEDGKTVEKDLSTPEALYDYLVEKAGQT
jgi:hypothetical protein